LIGRDAFENCVSPVPQKRSKPPPEPEIDRLMMTSGCAEAYSSAMASVSGPTVDEPSISIEPESSSEASGAGVDVEGAGAGAGAAGSSSAPPQAARTRADAARTAAVRERLRMVIETPCSGHVEAADRPSWCRRQDSPHRRLGP
jgi:hypothetical protein